MYSYLTNTGSFHFPYPESLRLAEHWFKELDMEQASEHNPWRRQTTDIIPNLWQNKKQQRDEEIFKFQAIWDLTMLQWRGNSTLENWRVVFNRQSHILTFNINMYGSDQLPQQPYQLLREEKLHPQSDERNRHLILWLLSHLLL